MPATTVDAGFADRLEKVAEPPLTVTPLCPPIEDEEELTKVTEAVAPLQPAGMLLTVTAVTFPPLTVQLVVAPLRAPQALTEEKPAPILLGVVAMPAAWATSGANVRAHS